MVLKSVTKYSFRNKSATISTISEYCMRISPSSLLTIECETHNIRYNGNVLEYGAVSDLNAGIYIRFTLNQYLLSPALFLQRRI